MRNEPRVRLGRAWRRSADPGGAAGAGQQGTCTAGQHRSPALCGAEERAGVSGVMHARTAGTAAPQPSAAAAAGAAAAAATHNVHRAPHRAPRQRAARHSADR